MAEDKKTYFEFVCDDILKALKARGDVSMVHIPRGICAEGFKPLEATRAEHLEAMSHWAEKFGIMSSAQATEVYHCLKTMGEPVHARHFVEEYLTKIVNDTRDYLFHHGLEYARGHRKITTQCSALSKLSAELVESELKDVELRKKVERFLKELFTIETTSLEQEILKEEANLRQVQERLDSLRNHQEFLEAYKPGCLKRALEPK